MPANVQEPKPNPATGGRDYRIAVRFGDRLLEAGHTAVPNLVLNHYARLGVSQAEMLFVIHVWQHWWNERDPYPSLGTIAERMGISRRQARNYVHSLKEKKFLTVNERVVPGLGQTTSEYDFAPLLEAIRKLDDSGSRDPRKDPSEGDPGNDPSEAPGNPVSYEEDEEQKDSALASKAARTREGEPPVPPRPVTADAPEHRDQRRPGSSSLAELLKRRADSKTVPPNGKTSPPPSSSIAATTPYLDQMVTELSQAIGDDAQLSSNLARVRRLMLSYGLDESSAVAALLRAHSLLKARSREGNAPVRRAGAYLFAILEDLLAASTAKETHGNEPRTVSTGQRSTGVPAAPKRPG